MDARRQRLLGALVERGELPRSSLIRVNHLGASLLAPTAYTAPAVQSPRTDAVYTYSPGQAPTGPTAVTQSATPTSRTDPVYVYTPGTTPPPAIPGVTQSATPRSPGAVTLPPSSTPTPVYEAPASARALTSRPLPWPMRVEPFNDLQGGEFALDCTPENVVDYLFRLGDYAYAQAALADLLRRKPAPSDIRAVQGWSRAVCDAVAVGLSALNLWHVPSADGRAEVIAKHYSTNPALALGFNPDLYRGYIEVPAIAEFWQRHFRGTAHLSTGSQYYVMYAPNTAWTSYGTAPRVLETATIRIPDPRRPSTAEMQRQSGTTYWDSVAYDRYVASLWTMLGGAANTTPSWLAIVGIPKRSESDIAWSRDTFWLARQNAQLEFCTAWADFIIGNSFGDLFRRCLDGWMARYVAPDAISYADAQAVSRGIKDLTSIGNVVGAWAAGVASAAGVLAASGPVGAVAAFAVSVLSSAVNWNARVQAAQALRIELARHPVIQPLFRRWFVAADCNASGGPALATPVLVQKYGAALSQTMTRLTAATTSTAPSGRSAAVDRLLTAKKGISWPLYLGIGAAILAAIALVKRKR